MSRFERCFVITLREEAGLPQEWGQPIRKSRWSYLNHPKDPGGATMCGVTHKAYDGWRRGRGLPLRKITKIDDAEIVSVYHDQYWSALPFDQVPPGVDVALFDMTFHSGPAQAVRTLQRSLGLQVDGHLGMVTLDVLRRLDAAQVVRGYMDARRRFIRSLRNYQSFKKNWEERMDRIERAALSEVGAEAVQPAIPEFVTEMHLEPPAPRATELPPDGMFDSRMGRGAIAAGTGGTTQVGMDAAAAAAKIKARGAFNLFDFLLELAQRPTFWIGVGITVSALYVWFERRRKMKAE